MAALDERVAFLEGRVGEHSDMVVSIRDALVSLEARMDRRFEQVDQRFLALEQRMDRRFEQVDARLDALDAKMSRQFLWLVGIVVTAMAAMLVTGVTR